MELGFLAILTVLALAYSANCYDNKYDNFDIKSVTDNERLLKAYAHCFLGDGKCTAEGNEIKEWIPEATTSSCGQCTEKQKTLVAKSIIAIRDKLPEEYNALIKKNDPEAKHGAELQTFLDKYGS